MILYELKLQDENATVIKAFSKESLYEEIFLNSYKYQLRSWMDFESIPDSIQMSNIDVIVPDDCIYIANGICKKKDTTKYLLLNPYTLKWE